MFCNDFFSTHLGVISGHSHGNCWNFATLVAHQRGIIVVNSKLLDDLQARLRETMTQSPAQDLDKNLRAMLAAVFSRFDLVTREEFDVQAEVLKRTREKLDRLEAKLAELEKNK